MKYPELQNTLLKPLQNFKAHLIYSLEKDNRIYTENGNTK